MPEFCLPILGFGDEDRPSTIVKWRDGTVICQGILGEYNQPVELSTVENPSLDNVVPFKRKKDDFNAPPL